LQEIRISVGDAVLSAELFDTETARAVSDALPLDTEFKTWGDEFYFEIPVKLPLDDTATTKVRVGDIGYWPTGSALAIFFGPTPMSTSEAPVPASKVNLVGRIKGDKGRISALLRDARTAESIRVVKIS
jgi:hypothetical protein